MGIELGDESSFTCSQSDTWQTKKKANRMARTEIQFALMACLLLAGTSTDAQILSNDAHLTAHYAEPTDRYPHHILGSVSGWGALQADLAPCANCAATRISITLPETGVFEDFEPHLWDLTGDGRPEVVVVESDRTKGARLVILEAVFTDGRPSLKQIGATPFLGTRFRWLAPIGAADFDGDGRIELAYVETPHLEKILHIVRLEEGRLDHVASRSGFTAHRIGQETIEGTIRDCASLPEIVLLSVDYKRVMGVTLTKGGLNARDLGPAEDARLPDSAISC